MGKRLCKNESWLVLLNKTTQMLQADHKDKTVEYTEAFKNIWFGFTCVGLLHLLFFELVSSCHVVNPHFFGS